MKKVSKVQSVGLLVNAECIAQQTEWAQSVSNRHRSSEHDNECLTSSSYVNSRSKCEMYFNFVVSHGPPRELRSPKLIGDACLERPIHWAHKHMPLLHSVYYSVTSFFEWSPYDVICILEPNLGRVRATAAGSPFFCEESLRAPSRREFNYTNVTLRESVSSFDRVFRRTWHTHTHAAPHHSSSR